MRHGLVMVLVCVGGCSPLHYTVDNDIFRDMSIDKKMRLFDAENDVSIAADDREQMKERMRELRQDIRAAERQADAVKGDDKQASQTREMWQKRIAYLEMSRRYLDDRAAIQDTAINLARAKFELAKALLVKKNKLSGAESLNPKDFETQMGAFAQKVKDDTLVLDREKSKLERLRADWLKLRDDLAASSLSGIAGPGEDELPVWQSW